MQLGQLRKAAWRMQSPYLYSPVRSMNTVTCNTSKCPDLCTVRWSSEMNAELHLPCAKKICLCYSINFETIFNSYARQMSHRPSGHSGEPRGQKGKIQMSRKASNFSQAFLNIELANWRNGKFCRNNSHTTWKTSSEMMSMVHLNVIVPDCEKFCWTTEQFIKVFVRALCAKALHSKSC